MINRKLRSKIFQLIGNPGVGRRRQAIGAGARRAHKVNGKPRVLYILNRYPQLSQTYISTEIRYLDPVVDLKIVALNDAPDPDPNGLPFKKIDQLDKLISYARKFQPDVIHSHWLVQSDTVGAVSAALGIPFTIRAHSFDVIHFSPEKRQKHIDKGIPCLNSELCLGVFSFPFTKPMLLDAGLKPEKFIPAGPVIDFQLFYDRHSNGEGVMNTGAAVPKKDMYSFIDLSSMVKERPFTLYPIGHLTPKLIEYNKTHGGSVTISPTIPHGQMPAEYKKQQWLVYTGSMETKNIGWPMAVAEAQASGVGVCVPNVRPDIRDYVGPSAIVYDSLQEVSEMIKEPLSAEAREAGFENAARFDIQRTKEDVLTLWKS